MKVEIEGREYPAVNHNSAQLLFLMELQQQAKGLVEGGLGMSALARMERELRDYGRALRLHRAAVERGEDSVEPEMPDAALTATAVSVFLTRRSAGDEVSFRDSMRVSLASIREIPEPSDVEADGGDVVDPQTPGSGGPEMHADAAPAA